MYETEVAAGRMEPVNPDVSIVIAARWWNMTPQEYLDMPVYWADLGQMVRHAESVAQQKAQGRNR